MLFRGPIIRHGFPLALSIGAVADVVLHLGDGAVELASFGFQILVVGLAIDGIRSSCSEASAGTMMEAPALGVEEGEVRTPSVPRASPLCCRSRERCGTGDDDEQGLKVIRLSWMSTLSPAP